MVREVGQQYRPSSPGRQGFESSSTTSTSSTSACRWYPSCALHSAPMYISAAAVVVVNRSPGQRLPSIAPRCSGATSPELVMTALTKSSFQPGCARTTYFGKGARAARVSPDASLGEKTAACESIVPSVPRSARHRQLEVTLQPEKPVETGACDRVVEMGARHLHRACRARRRPTRRCGRHWRDSSPGRACPRSSAYGFSRGATGGLGTKRERESYGSGSDSWFATIARLVSGGRFASSFDGSER